MTQYFKLLFIKLKRSLTNLSLLEFQPRMFYNKKGKNGLAIAQNLIFLKIFPLFSNFESIFLIKI